MAQRLGSPNPDRARLLREERLLALGRHMINLDDIELHLLRQAAEFSSMGGIHASGYQTARRLEKLRKLKLMKLYGRRTTKWISTFYDITDAGRALVARR